jgi:hypothetical protein
MTQPDVQQGLLLVHLAQWGTAMDFEEAAATIFDDDWDPESASADDMAVRKVLQFGETIGTLVKQGLFEESLALDWLWLAGLWERVAPAALKSREKFGQPQLYENFEALAGKQA